MFLQNASNAHSESTDTVSNNVATWSTLTNVSATGQNADAPQIGVSSDGTKAVAVWTRSDGANVIVQAAPMAPS